MKLKLKNKKFIKKVKINGDGERKKFLYMGKRSQYKLSNKL